jgi:hypothetical protein
VTKKILLPSIFILFSCVVSSASYALAWTTSYPLYIGFSGGWGSTNWSGLVDKNGAEDGSDLSVPVKAKDTGDVWGALAGYEISPHFALQAEYKQYPTALIKFDEFNQYFPVAENVESSTDVYNATAKFEVPIWHTGIRAFSNLGPSYTYRRDALANIGHWGATFGAGFNYDVTRWLMTEVNFEYTTGWDTANTTPVMDYLPFLYSVNGLIAVRFNV